MKISFETIRENLGKCCNIKAVSGINNEFVLNRPLFAEKNTRRKADMLYILEDRDVDKIRGFRESYFIIVGTSDILKETDILNYMIIDDDHTVGEIFNLVNNVFDKYETWEENVNDILIHAGSIEALQNLVDVSEEVFDNPINVVDCNYRVIVLSEMAKAQEAYKNNSEYGAFVPDDVIDNFRNNEKFRQYYNSAEPFIDEDIFQFRGLSKNIVSAGRMKYRITISEINRGFLESDFVLIEKLAEYVELLINRLASGIGFMDHNIGRLLRQIIETGLSDNDMINEELEIMGWKRNDTYLLVYMVPSSTDVLISVLGSVSELLNRQYRETFSFTMNDRIVMLINAEKIGKDLNNTLRELTVFIRDNNFRVGISNRFNEILQINKYCRQAETALDIGYQKNPTEWVFKFRDYTLQYMYNKVTAEFLPEELLSPSYLLLEEYDNANGTEYLDTLKCYLDNNMNASKTAEQLFIHRATIIFRLKRICEIGKIDFKKRDELLHLCISYILKRS